MDILCQMSFSYNLLLYILGMYTYVLACYYFVTSSFIWNLKCVLKYVSVISNITIL
jgi:hypothetical protein